MRELMTILKALADESRVRVVMALRGRELCVCQIVALLQLATSTVSKHMAILKQAGLVESRKEGRWVFYRPATAEESPRAARIIQPLAAALADDPMVAADARRLREILTLDPEALCRQQSECK